MDVFRVLHRASGCHNKRVIYNKLGEPLLVPCGTCSYCINSKFSRYKNLCDRESGQNAYTVFVTLTYDNDHLPLMRYACPFDLIGYADKPVALVTETFLVSMRNNRRRKFSCPTIVTSDFIPSGMSFSKYTERQYYICQPKDKYGHLLQDSQILYKGERAMGYLDHYDVQTFLKRLRSKISYKYGEKIRYFYCSEYGPKTFRPHFHLLLFFNSSALRDALQSLISECWKFGDVRYSLTCGANSYVSAYVSADSRLPFRYRNSAFEISPKKRHSNFFGSSSFEYTLPRILANDDKDTYAVTLLAKTAKRIPLTLSDLSSVLPKIPFSTQHHQTAAFEVLHTCLRLLQRSKDITGCSKFSRSKFSESLYDCYALGAYPSSDLVQPISQVAWYLSLNPSSDAVERALQHQRISTLFDYARNYYKRYRHFTSDIAVRRGFIGDDFTKFKYVYDFLYKQFNLLNLRSFYEQVSLVSQSFPDSVFSLYIDTFESRTSSLNLVFINDDINQSLNSVKHRELNSIYEPLIS